MTDLRVGVGRKRMVKKMSIKKDNRQLNRLSGRYEIIEQVGVGGMSYVYKAFDTKRNKIVAIKILKEELSIDEEFVKKFRSEALACIDIKQENVISAYDVVDEDNMHYIVMEYVEGKTLNKYIKEKGKLTNEETVNLSLQIAKGIKAAHEKGIIHRDIKPQNIVINNNGIAKITDFGIARAITSTTKNISVIGTVHYISPEQVRNENVDFRSDIYSFGCTMYEMITGAVPFEGDAPIEIIISHLRNNLNPVHLKNPDVYKSLEKIISKATRMVTDERYQTIDELIEDLEQALKNKDGEYIKESVHDDDEEGNTVIITEEDMKVIKAVSQKFTNKQNYKTNDGKLSPEEQAFYEKYIKDGSFKHHIFMRRVISGSILALVLLIIIMVFIALDTKKKVPEDKVIATGSITFANIVKSISGLDLDFATNLFEEYGISINVLGEEYNDDVEFGKITRVVNDNLNTDMSIDVMVSKGPEVLNFSNTEILNQTRWEDMKKMLADRDLRYEYTEINSSDIPDGYIVGVNKEKSNDPGSLIFIVSKSQNEQIKVMPNLLGKPISEARELLYINDISLGNISYIKSDVVNANCIISQSLEPGSEVRNGISVDLVISSGVDGAEYQISKKKVWHGEFSSTYKVDNKHIPANENVNTLIIQVRLVQNTNEGVVYTELIEPQEYRVGTIIPLIFPDIEGEENIQSGQLQVVDVERDSILMSANVAFWSEGE